jgi:hypothetical protein
MAVEELGTIDRLAPIGFDAIELESVDAALRPNALLRVS